MYSDITFTFENGKDSKNTNSEENSPKDIASKIKNLEGEEPILGLVVAKEQNLKNQKVKNLLEDCHYYLVM